MAMGWSGRGRLLYFLLTIVFLAIIAILALLVFKPIPSCFDGRRNQDELGVDCGGACAKVCPFEVREVREIWTQVFAVDEGKYDVATFLKNPNSQHGVKILNYLIKLFDAENLLITTRTGTASLNPDESLIIFNPRLPVGQRVPARAIFELLEPPVWQKVDQEIPTPEVRMQTFTNTPTPKLLATVRNPSLYDLHDVTVVAVLSDNEQNAVAISSTLVESLPRGETRDLVFTWPRSLTTEPVFFDFYPHLELATISQ